MKNQRLISLKLDVNLIPELDSLCVEYGVKRNRMINALIASGIQCLKAKSSKFASLSVLSDSKVYTLLTY